MVTKMRLIDLDDLMKFPIRWNHYDKENGSEEFIYGVENVLDYAQALPIIDAENVRLGSWEWARDGYLRCSVCTQKAPVMTQYQGEPMVAVTNYCPYCGSRMKLEE